MKHLHNKLFLYGYLMTFSLLFISTNSNAQGIEIEQKDTTAINAIPIAQIPLAMVQTQIKTIKVLNDIIQPNLLKQKSADNDSLLAKVKSSLDVIKESTRDTKSVRYLQNRKLQLVVQEDNVKDLSDEFSSLISDMDKANSFFKDEKKRWNITKKDLEKDNFSSDLLSRVDYLDFQLDSALQVVSDRTESIFLILENNAKVAIEIEDLLNQIEDTTRSLEAKLLKVDRPSIFNLDYSIENLTFKTDVKYYMKEVYLDLKNYFNRKQAGLYILLILFITLLYLGNKYKAQLTDLDRYGNSYYQRKLGQILNQPINAAILLSLVFSNIIFTERPYAFRDVFGLLLIIPLIQVSRQLLPKTFHKYISWFALLILPLAIYVIFPPENVYFRFNLIVIAIGELFIIINFYKKIKNLDYKKYPKLDKKLAIAFCLVFMLFAAIGLLGSIIGNVLLAQIVLFTNFYAIYGGAVLYATSIMINGFALTYLDSSKAKKVNAIFKYNYVIRKRLVRFVNVVIMISWILIIANQLKIKDPIQETIFNFLGEDWKLGALSINIGEILIFLIVIWVSTFLAKIIQIILEDDVLSKMPMAKGLPHSIAVLIRYMVITVGVMLAVSSAGLNMSSLAVILGAFGVGIGFGLQNIFNNLVSGLILLFERPVQIGDTIEIGDLIGVVKQIGIRSSNIRTIDGAEVIVPNGNLISNEVINWTLSDSQRRIEVIVGVSYSSSPHQVLKILNRVLKDHPQILQDPEPSVYFQELGDSSLNFRMLFWASSYDEWLKIKSEVITQVFDDLGEAGIEIPFPQRDIHIRSFEEKLNIEQVKTPESKQKSIKNSEQNDKLDNFDELIASKD